MKTFAVFGVLVIFASLSWNVDCAPQQFYSESVNYGLKWTENNGNKYIWDFSHIQIDFFSFPHPARMVDLPLHIE